MYCVRSSVYGCSTSGQAYKKQRSWGLPAAFSMEKLDFANLHIVIS